MQDPTPLSEEFPARMQIISGFTQFFLCLTYFFLLYYNVAIHAKTLYLLKGEYYYEKESS